MKTRRLVLLVGLGTLAVPLVSFAQEPKKIPRVGFLTPAGPSPEASAPFLALKDGMRELGYIDGKNLVFEWRSAHGNYERLPQLALELVDLKVDVIVAMTVPGVHAAQKATTTVPIVMAAVGNPVGTGFAVSLARPGGNITGFSNVVWESSTKHLELLRAALPKISRVAILANPSLPTHPGQIKEFEATATKMGMKTSVETASSTEQIDGAFARMRKERIEGLVVLSDPFFTRQGRQIAQLALSARLPSIFSSHASTEAGGLMSYGLSNEEMYRRAAVYVDKILRGARPGDLPIEQPTKFELVVNLKTAKALGLTLPQSFLMRADRVIE